MRTKTHGQARFRSRTIAAIGIAAAILAACAADDGNATDPVEDDEATDEIEDEDSASEPDEDPPPDDGEVITLRYASSLGPDTPEVNAMSVFKDYVESESEGRIQVELFDGGALGGVEEGVQQTVSGAIDLTHAAPSWWQTVSPGIGVMDLPYLFTTADQAREAMDGDIGEAIAEEMYESGVVVMGWYDLGFRHTLNNVRPIESLEDFSGLTIRFQDNPTHLDAFAALGADPIPLDWTEVYPSMQQGVVDGVENSLGIILSANLYEVSEYLTLTNHVHGSMVVMMNRDTWDEIPEDLQEIIREGHRREVEHQREESSNLEANAIEELEGHGLQINELDEETLNEIAEIARSVYDDHADRIGQELVDTAVASVGGG